VPFREQVTATDYNRKLPRDPERVHTLVEPALRLRSSDTEISQIGFFRGAPRDGPRLTASDG